MMGRYNFNTTIIQKFVRSALGTQNLRSIVLAPLGHTVPFFMLNLSHRKPSHIPAKTDCETHHRRIVTLR